MQTHEIVIDSSKKSGRPLLVGVCLVFGVLVAAGVASTYWPVATNVSLEVDVSRAEWTLGLFPSQQILKPILVESIDLQEYSSVEFSPISLLVADPEQPGKATETSDPSHWDAITVLGGVRLSPKTQETLIRVHTGDTGETILGTLGSIQVREETNVILEVNERDPRVVTVKILGPESSVRFTPTQPLEIIAAQTNVTGLKEFPLMYKTSLAFRPELPEHRNYIDIQGTKQQLVLTVKVAASQGPTVLSEQAIPIKAIDFSRKDDSGMPVSTLVSPGTLQYTDFPDFPAKTIPATDLVHIQPHKILTIKRITLLPDRPGFGFSLSGTAKSIQTGSEESFIDHRVTFADRILNDSESP